MLLKQARSQYCHEGVDTIVPPCADLEQELKDNLRDPERRCFEDVAECRVVDVSID
jgi:hypothetical protein